MRSRTAPRRPSPLVAGVGASVLLLLATGCGSIRVEGDGPDAPRARAACRDLVEALPERLDDLERAATSGNEYAAAWGDPPVVLRCGVAEPAELTPVSRCERVGDVDWFAPEAQSEDQSSAVVLTTVGRDPRVELYVPASRRPPAGLLTDLADAVKQTTRELEPCR